MSSAPAVAAGKTYSVVVVEDEAILALSLERTLRELGLDFRGVAASAYDAIALADRERPDVVLMDIRIQGSRDGVEAADVIRRQHDVAIVYLTANSDPKTIERAQATRPAGYLLKPFKKTDLQNVVNIALSRRDVELELRRREEALRITLSAIDEAVVTTDLRGVVTSVNEAATQLVGRDDGELLQRPLAEVIPFQRRDEAREGAREVVVAAGEGERVALDVVLETPAGARSLMGTAVSLRQRGVPFGVVVALRDLTDLLVTRRQLEFAERLSSLGTMAAGVAHEINNPLSIVLMNLELALDESLGVNAQRYLREARDASQRVVRIVSSLRLLSKPQPEPVKQFDVREPLMRALNFTRASWKKVSAVELQLERTPLVLGSPTRITQVLVNLIINATQAMHSVGDARHKLSLISTTGADGRALLKVRDTGPGIPESLRERIFEPFFTTKSVGEGTGLGLAVSRSIILQHNATMTVDSSSGGTCFTIAFDAVGEAAARAAPVLWIGESAPGAIGVDDTHVPPVADAVGAALNNEQIVVAQVSRAQLQSLMVEVPGVESRLVWAGDEEPEVGEVRLLRPFDPAALQWFYPDD